MRLRRISGLLLAVLLAMFSLANELNAQTTTSGGLTGVVADPSQAVVPDADVQIKDNAKGTQSTKSDREGVYQFSRNNKLGLLFSSAASRCRRPCPSLKSPLYCRSQRYSAPL
jgi:hypothetical protein